MQRELLMPHSVPERELQFAKQTLQRLQKGSSETIFSYPRLQGDTPNLPCSLITGFPNFERLPPIFEPVIQSFLIAREETYNVPLRLEEHISGGTALLANQAKCPFKAFAEHRLKASPSTYTSDGLDNKEKGQIIHKVMELLWQTLHSQEELFNINPKDLDLLIEKAIHTALSPIKQLQRDSFSNLIEEVESTRLKRLVLASLEWEKKRPPFVIAAIEQSYSINLAGLDFKVRVDRIDQVADKKWVIDYKSSLPVSKPWNEDRPKEPQLLLYALLDEHINTLLLMQLKTGKVACSGLSEEKLDLSGLTSLKKEETWEEYRNNWQQQLTLLANEFQQGHSVPQPVSPLVCQQCNFQNLCRFQINQ
jgi:probable DNA repair protein